MDPGGGTMRRILAIASAVFILAITSSAVSAQSTTPTVATRQPREGKPKIEPAFVKAIAGHIYVVRIVDEKSDFYALFSH